MDILGIGPLELFFIIILVLVIFGPNDIVNAARTLGKFMRNVVTSEGWRAFQQASKGMKDLPTTLMREAGLEEEDLRQMTGLKDLERVTKDFENQISPWTTPPTKKPSGLENSTNSSPSEQTPINETDEAKPDTDQETQPQKPASPPPESPFSQNIDD